MKEMRAIYLNLMILYLIMLVNPPAFAQLNVISLPKNAHSLIVFVHGLNGDDITTWTNSNKFHFPTGLSADSELKEFAVAAFKYPAVCNNVTPKEAANRLSQEIDRIGDFHAIHLIGHSLGGIILRQLLIDDPNKNFSSIQLLGTPNLGSSWEPLSNEICRNAGIQRIRELLSGRGSYLDSLNDSWRRLFEQNDGKKKFKFFAAFELPQGLIRLPIVVEKESALLFSSITTYFESDHMALAKPESASDPIFKWVKGNILTSVEGKLRKTRYPEPNKDLRYEQIEASLLKIKNDEGSRFAEDIVSALNRRDFELVLASLNSSKINNANKTLLSALIDDLRGNYSVAISKYVALEKHQDTVNLARQALVRYNIENSREPSSNQFLLQLSLQPDDVQMLMKGLSDSQTPDRNQ